MGFNPTYLRYRGSGRRVWGPYSSASVPHTTPVPMVLKELPVRSLDGRLAADPKRLTEAADDDGDGGGGGGDNGENVVT